MLSLPPERRLRQPFVLDVAAFKVIAPWPRKCSLPGDEVRMDEMLSISTPRRCRQHVLVLAVSG